MQGIKPSMGVTPTVNKKVLGRYDNTEHSDFEEGEDVWSYRIVYWDGSSWRGAEDDYSVPPPLEYAYLELAFETYNDINNN